MIPNWICPLKDQTRQLPILWFMEPGGAHYGLRLVEIDYLHERRPAPSYLDGIKDALPYSVLVSDPRPTFSEGAAPVYNFGVQQPLPVISIPLEGRDSVGLDLGMIYNQTYEKRAFRSRVDYGQLPLNFNRYSPPDQEYIRRRMAEIAAM
jgi:hypothetical protein